MKMLTFSGMAAALMKHKQKKGLLLSNRPFQRVKKVP